MDEIDLKILNLLNERAGCAIEIGKIKRKMDIEIFDPNREEQIFVGPCDNNKGPIENESIKSIFKKIIEEIRNIEKKTK